MNINSTNKQFETFIGVDLGDKYHQVCVTDKDGNILEESSIPNERIALQRLCEEHPESAVAIEVGTHSPWISRLLEAGGMDVTVANARKLRAIYQNERKCDVLDARMLAKLRRADRDLLSPLKHSSEQAQKDLMAIKLRDTLVRQRVKVVAAVRGILKSVGLRIPNTSTASFHRKAGDFLAKYPELLPAIEPSLKTLEMLTGQIKVYDKHIANTAKKHHPEALRLQEIPSIGPITSLAFVLSIEDPKRFKAPRDVGAYLGLVPRRDQSGGTDKELPISKCGNRYLRQLLVQSAQYVLGHFGPDCTLRRHGLRLAAKGGRAAKKKAVIAVARKLAVMMVAMWKKGGSYEPFPGQQDDGARAASPGTGECETQMATC